MRFEMKMPDLATTELEIRVVRWLIQPGQRVERGRPIVEVETDKATMEVESVVSGVLQEVRAKVDDAVSVGNVIAVLEVADARPSPSGPAATSGPAPAPAAAAPLPRAGAVAAAGGMFARNRAAASATAAAAPPAAAPAGIPLSTPQRVMARRMHESKQTIPHYYLQTSVDATAMAAARRAAAPGEIAWDAFFVRAAARAWRDSTASAAGSTASICGRPGPTPSAWPSITRASCSSFRWQRRRARRSGKFRPRYARASAGCGAAIPTRGASARH